MCRSTIWICRGESWEVIFGELSQILTPDQIQQLIERIVRDVQETGAFIYEMAESEKLLRGDFGGES